jgi:hypothetical protein
MLTDCQPTIFELVQNVNALRVRLASGDTIPDRACGDGNSHSRIAPGTRNLFRHTQRAQERNEFRVPDALNTSDPQKAGAALVTSVTFC